MNNYSIFGPTIYIENSSQNQRQNSSSPLPNLNELFSNLFSTDFNDILQNSMNNLEEKIIKPGQLQMLKQIQRTLKKLFYYMNLLHTLLQMD